jgi:predicted nucleic acid-binding protein
MQHQRLKTFNGVREANMPLITISQGVGGDGVAMASRVSKVLNAGLYDDSKLRAEAIRLGLGVSGWFGLMRNNPAQTLD